MPEQPPPSSPSGAPPTRLTGRAAVLAVVICAIALSLAYPVREYIAQRQQINQLAAQNQTMSAQVKSLETENGQLAQPWYIEQRARDELHMCFPGEQCYTVLDGQSPYTSTSPPAKAVTPWYTKLWQSVQRAGQEPAK
jgi:cell division protein FtsB